MDQDKINEALRLQKIQATLNIIANKVSDLKSENVLMERANKDLSVVIAENKNAKEISEKELLVVKDEVAKLEEKKDALMSRSAELEKKIGEQEIVIKDKEAKIAEQEVDIAKRIIEIEKREADILPKEKDLAERIKIIETNEATLKNYSEELELKEALLTKRESMLVVKQKLDA